MVSCYANKAFDSNLYGRKRRFSRVYKKMVIFSLMSPVKAKELILNQIEKMRPGPSRFKWHSFLCNDNFPTLNNTENGNFTLLINKKGKKVPSFRGFVLALLYFTLQCWGDPSCVHLDRHMKSQVMRCAPCNSNFDTIMKV